MSFTWTDKQNNVDIVDADDINSIANEAIRLNEEIIKTDEKIEQQKIKNDVGGYQIGDDSYADTDGIAFGTKTYSNSSGVAIGTGAQCDNDGVAIGTNTEAVAAGISIGEGTISGKNGVAIGSGAKVNAEDAVQIGAGVNDESDTVNFFGYKLFNSSGNIPPERLGLVMPRGNVSGYPIATDDHFGGLSPSDLKVWGGCGKNLIPYPFFSGTTTVDGVTFTDNGDGTVTINGTATNSIVYAVRHKLEYWVVPKGIYTFSGSSSQTESDKVSMIFVLYKGGEIQAQFYESGSGKSVDTTELDYDAVTIFISVPKGRTCENLVFRPQLELGETATAFEAYTGIGNRNLIPYPYRDSTKTVGGVVFEDNGDGSIGVRGTPADTATFTLTKTPIPVTGGATYTFSAGAKDASNIDFRMGIYNAAGSIIKSVTTTESIYTITVPDDAVGISIYMSRSNINQECKGIFFPQLELGTTATPYTPYGCYSIPVYCCGKNLFNAENADYLIGYFTRTVTKITTHANARSIYIPCEPNTTYTISRDTGYSNFHFGYTAELPKVGVKVSGAVSDSDAKSLTITTGADAKYLVAYLYNGYSAEGQQGGWDSIIGGIQIEKGNTATEYERYYAQSIVEARLDSPLEAGEYIDILNKKRYSADGSASNIKTDGEMLLSDSARCEIYTPTQAKPEKIEMTYYRDISRVIDNITSAIVAIGGNA